MMIGIILVGFGIILLGLNRGAKRMDSPEAQRTTKWICFWIILFGAIVIIGNALLGVQRYGNGN